MRRRQTANIYAQQVADVINANPFASNRNVAAILHVSESFISAKLKECKNLGVPLLDRKALIKAEMQSNILITAMLFISENQNTLSLADRFGVCEQVISKRICEARKMGLLIKPSNTKPSSKQIQTTAAPAKQAKRKYNPLAAPDMLRVPIGRTWHRKPFTWSYADICNETKGV